MRAWIAAVLACGLLGLAGCGGGGPIVSTVTQPTAPLPGAALTGVVSSGSQPIVGAHVYLLAANTTGYGGSGLSASSSNASVSVVAEDETGDSDAVGAYVVTGANGQFSLTGDYACSSGQQLYLYALGGNTGSGVNSAAGLMAMVGSCPSSSSPAVFATVNEVSTVAAAYALAGFATDSTHVSSSGTALAQVGVANAFANAANLATLGTGAALATTPAGNGTVPQAEINTLANILAACVNTNGAVTGTTNAPTCFTLFTRATSNGALYGTFPTDTATAAINIAHNPGSNIAALYGLATAAVFAPALPAQPNDFTLTLNFAGAGPFEPNSLAIDGSGDVWTANSSADTATKLSSLGAPLSGNGFTGGGMNNPQAIAIDSSGNAWVANTGNSTVIELSTTGKSLSGTAGFALGISGNPWGIAIDGFGNAWIANHSGGTMTELSSSGALLSGAGFITGAGLYDGLAIAIDGSDNAWVTTTGVVTGPDRVVELSSTGGVLSGGNGFLSDIGAFGIAIDSAGNAWVTQYGGTSSLVKLSNAGVPLSGSGGYGGGGLSLPDSIAIDGAGNVWVANLGVGSASEFANSGVALSPSTGFMGGGLNAPVAIAVDGSGDVWVTSQQQSTISELVGAGTPVVTPLAVGVKNNMLGTRP